MERLCLVFVMIMMCSALPKDLSGKMFTFPAESETAYVRLTPSSQSFAAVTVCLRYFTDIKKSKQVSYFSMSIPSSPNGFLLFKDENGIELLTRNIGAYTQGLPDEQNMWASLCGTWNSATGLIQVWVNGKQGVRRVGYKAGELTGNPIIIVGQEQDSYGGKYDKLQSFVGHLSDIHMWDYVLSPCELLRFSGSLPFTPGNVLNWRALTFSINGNVILDDKLVRCEEE